MKTWWLAGCAWIGLVGCSAALPARDPSGQRVTIYDFPAWRRSSVARVATASPSPYRCDLASSKEAVTLTIVCQQLDEAQPRAALESQAGVAPSPGRPTIAVRAK